MTDPVVFALADVAVVAAELERAVVAERTPPVVVERLHERLFEALGLVRAVVAAPANLLPSGDCPTPEVTSAP